MSVLDTSRPAEIRREYSPERKYNSKCLAKKEGKKTKTNLTSVTTVAKQTVLYSFITKVN